MPHDIQRETLKEQIDAVLEAIEAVKEAEGGRATVKQLEKQRENMEARYELLLAGTGKKDTSVDFADLGVDALFVDESHEFKNLAYQTTMNVSGLGDISPRFGQSARSLHQVPLPATEKRRPGRVLSDRHPHIEYHCRSVHAPALAHHAV